MYLQLIVSSVLINFVSADDLHEYLSKNVKPKQALMGSSGRTNTGRIQSTGYHLWNQHNWKPQKGTPYNLTYIDKAENMIRLPTMNKYNEEKKGRRKTFKKTPRRTIQKIIKKNSRSKIKRLYMVKMTSSYPTVAPNEFVNEQDDYSARKAEMTTRSNQQKKTKKFSVKQVKVPRYPISYRKMQTRKNNYRRPKRETQDIFIFKDFDSMQFVKGKTDDDYNVLNAHFKKHW